MSKQALSIEQIQHLRELGVDTSNSNFYWHRTKSLNNYEEWDEWKLHYGVLKLARGFKTINCEYVNTFTLQDILDLLPKRIEHRNKYYELTLFYSHASYEWKAQYLDDNVSFMSYKGGDELIDAVYEMLCWCAENGYIELKNES